MLRFKISIHAPTRGATTENAYATFHTKISIHAPTRGATYVSEKIYTYFEISIHAPTRGATMLKSLFWHTQTISIHAPTRGATNLTTPKQIRFLISIHAPTRGATVLDGNYDDKGQFQSTLPRGERQTWRLCEILQRNLNPRSHEGSDGHSDLRERLKQYISIHAPTRGATTPSASTQDLPINFNPRSHEGSDARGLLRDLSAYKFQSTLPRGERRSRSSVRPIFRQFQSTLPRGERLQH